MNTRLFPLQTSFEIGETEKHTVMVRFAPISGREWVWIDGVEVWNRRNLAPGSTISIPLEGGKHRMLELRVQPMPFKCSVWLDGVLHIDSLFPEVTAAMIHAETIMAVSPYLCAGMIILWLVLGGWHEAEPSRLILTATLAVLWLVMLAWHWRRPRIWTFIVTMVVPITVGNQLNSRLHSGSWHFGILFFAFATGLIAVLSPWLREFVRKDQCDPSSLK